MPNEVWTDKLNESEIAIGVLSGQFAFACDQLDMGWIRGEWMSPADSCEQVQEMQLHAAKRRMGPFVRKGSHIRKMIDYRYKLLHRS